MGIAGGIYERSLNGKRLGGYQMIKKTCCYLDFLLRLYLLGFRMYYLYGPKECGWLLMKKVTGVGKD